MTWTERLEKLGQSHLLKECSEDSKDQILKQLTSADANYPGGLETYLKNARKLLQASKNNEDSFAGYIPSKPPTFEVPLKSMEELECLELKCRDVLHQVGFVLVAGGLGERLGYPDIKVKLFTQVTAEMTYLEYYCKSILKCQQTAQKALAHNAAAEKAKPLAQVKLPFFIMTSGDTHERTMSFLKEKNYFGLDPDQVYVRQQEKVPALRDSAGHIALTSDKKSIETKPHGHGDVHLILYQQKLLETFKQKHGTEWLFFFQDTNALAFRVMHALIGISVREGLTMNSLAIPRKPGEAVGAICKLTPKGQDSEVSADDRKQADGASSGGTPAASGGDRRPMVLNVEYNQLDSLLKSSGLSGDVPEEGCPEGLSKFPGNCNILVFKMSEYCKVLEKSGGLIPEFINPKYSDSSRESFKSPTRIECMMQEIPRMFSPDQKHGCTVAERWFCFSTVKNCCDDASKKVTPECAFSAEQDLYLNSRKCLELVLGETNVTSEPPVKATYNGVTYPEQCRVWISPEMAVSVSDIKDNLSATQTTKINLKHNSAFMMTSEANCKLLDQPMPKALSELELKDPKISTNYKVRGYMPAN